MKILNCKKAKLTLNQRLVRLVFQDVVHGHYRAFFIVSSTLIKDSMFYFSYSSGKSFTFVKKDFVKTN